MSTLSSQDRTFFDLKSPEELEKLSEADEVYGYYFHIWRALRTGWSSLIKNTPANRAPALTIPLICSPSREAERLLEELFLTKGWSLVFTDSPVEGPVVTAKPALHKLSHPEDPKTSSFIDLDPEQFGGSDYP